MNARALAIVLAASSGCTDAITLEVSSNRPVPTAIDSVCVGVATLMPFGIVCTTGCEKPSDRLSLSPAACAR